MDCHGEIEETSKKILNAFRSGCNEIRRLINDMIICRTPTRGVLSAYAMYQLGDLLGRRLGPNDPESQVKRLLKCWVNGDREVKFILSVALGRFAMAYPLEVELQVASFLHLDDGSLSKWVVPILMIWDKGSFFRILYRNGAAKRPLIDSLIWFVKYSPNDIEFALYVINKLLQKPDKHLHRVMKEMLKLRPSIVREKVGELETH